MSLDSSCICSMRSILSRGGAAQQLRSMQHLQDVEQLWLMRDSGGESPSTPRGSGLSGWHSQLGEPHPHPLRFVAIARKSDHSLPRGSNINAWRSRSGRNRDKENDSKKCILENAADRRNDERICGKISQLNRGCNLLRDTAQFKNVVRGVQKARGQRSEGTELRLRTHQAM